LILTDRFVYIHQPKTGGTFVTSMLERIYNYKKPRTLLRKALAPIVTQSMVNVEKHGPCDAIPESHRDKPIIATFRNPYSRYVSQYHFAWWKQFPPSHVDQAAIMERFPTFPELDFDQFLELMNDFYQRFGDCKLQADRSPGFNTRQFLRFYTKDPDSWFADIDEAWMDRRGWEDVRYPVRFLRQDHLNQDLHDALIDFGHSADEVGFILEHEKVLPRTPKKGSRPRKHWSEYWTEERKEVVRRRDRILFEIFPEYDA
jgi:hypothetical protein